MIQNYKLFNCVNDRVCCQCNLIKRDERKYNYYIFRSSIVTEYDLNLKMNHKVVIQIYQRCAEYKVTRFKIWKTLKNKNTKALHCYLKALPSIRRGGKKREKQVIFKGKSSLGEQERYKKLKCCQTPVKQSCLNFDAFISYLLEQLKGSMLHIHHIQFQRTEPVLHS